MFHRLADPGCSWEITAMQTLKSMIHSKIPETVQHLVEAFPMSSGLEIPA